MSVRYFGCHGVRLAPEALAAGLGWSSSPPPLQATVSLAERVDRGGGRRLWRGEWPARADQPEQRLEAWVDEDGRIWMGGSHPPALQIDLGTGAIVVEEREPVARNHALAGLALPVVAQNAGRVVLHGVAAVRDGEATVVCAPSGGGKSSLLLGLLAAGWQALSEDLSVLDPGGRPPLVWPGPPWVRLLEPPERPALRLRHELPRKHAWDLEPHMCRAPAPLRHLVFMERTIGGEPSLERITPAAALPHLSQHSMWLLRQRGAVAALFSRGVALASAVTCHQLRMPRTSGWPEDAVSLIGSVE